jgi:hypothetical protein
LKLNLKSHKNRQLFLGKEGDKEQKMPSRLLMKAESCVNKTLFVIEDEAHGRILSRLKSGERYVKSFVLGRCPQKVGHVHLH